MAPLGRGRVSMPKDYIGEAILHSLRAVWALVCRVSGTGNLENEEASVRSELKGAQQGYEQLEWDSSDTEEGTGRPQC